jgi:hypothetical protein
MLFLTRYACSNFAGSYWQIRHKFDALVRVMSNASSGEPYIRRTCLRLFSTRRLWGSYASAQPRMSAG